LTVRFRLVVGLELQKNLDLPHGVVDKLSKNATGSRGVGWNKSASG
jgi:hypothetical protein